MRNRRPLLLVLVCATACASGGASETYVAPAGTMAATGRQMKEYTAMATAVPVSPDSAYRLLLQVYATLALPAVPVDENRTVGNDDLKVRRHIAGLAMQNVVDCGDKLGLENAETWEIDMNLVSYVKADPSGGSQVLTKIQAMGHRPEGAALRKTSCASRGELEKKIGDMVVQLATAK